MWTTERAFRWPSNLRAARCDYPSLLKGLEAAREIRQAPKCCITMSNLCLLRWHGVTYVYRMTEPAKLGLH